MSNYDKFMIISISDMESVISVFDVGTAFKVHLQENNVQNKVFN